MRNHPQTNHTRLSGFTLVELLVVIAIIAVLAALAFGVITKMTAKGKTTASINNLRQLHVAAESFAGENRQIYPATYWGDPSADPPIPKAYWWAALGPYLYSDFESTGDGNGLINGMFRDRADSRVRSISEDEFRGGSWSEISYMPWANGTTSGSAAIRGISVSRTQELAGQPYLTTAINTGTWACADEAG